MRSVEEKRFPSAGHTAELIAKDPLRKTKMGTLELQIRCQVGGWLVGHIAPFEEKDVEPGATQFAGKGQTGWPSSDDAEIDSEGRACRYLSPVSQHGENVAASPKSVP